MELKKTTIHRFLGAIIALSAVGIMVLKYFTHGDLDSYILPLILLCMSAVIFTNKADSEVHQIKYDSVKGKIVLSVLVFLLISGVVTFFMTF